MGRVSVIEERCKGCGYCIDACKLDSLELNPDRRNSNGYSVAVFYEDRECTGCAMCADVCPDAALVVYR